MATMAMMAMKMNIYLDASAREGVPQLLRLIFLLISCIILVIWIALVGVLPHHEALAGGQLHLPVGHTVGTARVGQLVRVVGGVGGASLGKAAQSEALAVSVIDTMATLDMQPLAQLTRQVVDLRLRGDHLLVLGPPQQVLVELGGLRRPEVLHDGHSEVWLLG